jgi:hypothetical protein
MAELKKKREETEQKKRKRTRRRREEKLVKPLLKLLKTVRYEPNFSSPTYFWTLGTERKNKQHEGIP